jgi:hypothetical protein
VFRHNEYRGKQEEIVEAAVSGTLLARLTFFMRLIFTTGSDILVVAPTGMGKVRTHVHNCFAS